MRIGKWPLDLKSWSSLVTFVRTTLVERSEEKPMDHNLVGNEEMEIT